LVSVDDLNERVNLQMSKLYLFIKVVEVEFTLYFNHSVTVE